MKIINRQKFIVTSIVITKENKRMNRLICDTNQISKIHLINVLTQSYVYIWNENQIFIFDLWVTLVI